MKWNLGWIGGLSISLGLIAGAGMPVSAAKPVAIEKELLGVRVLQNYHEVLMRYGAPTRIFRATETVNYREAVSLAGTSTGGILDVLDSSSGGAGGSGGPMMGGPMMGGGGMSGMMRGGGKGGGMAGMDGGPGMAGSPGLPGGGGSIGGGAGQGGSDNPDSSYSESGGFTWVYLYPFKELAYEFHFNKDGRVERIAELGRGWGQHTSRGIGLGDTLEKIYSIYGWTDRIKDEDNGKFSLLYNDRYHAQFLILKNKVVGISVFLKENQFMLFGSGSGGGAGGSMMGGSMMGGQMGRQMMGGQGGGQRAGKPQIGPMGGGGKG
jgi:hypothetical protein